SQTCSAAVATEADDCEQTQRPFWIHRYSALPFLPNTHVRLCPLYFCPRYFSPRGSAGSCGPKRLRISVRVGPARKSRFIDVPPRLFGKRSQKRANGPWSAATS